MDFTFIAQYPVHTGETVEFMEDALLQYHENLSIFCDLGLRRHFNLPKLHFASHYGDLVKLFGTTDNFNTENTEHLHIDIAKDMYEATNHKDEFSQMTVWQERKEKIHKHDSVIKWWQEGSPPITAPVMTTLRQVSDFVYFLSFLFSLYHYPEHSGTFYPDPPTSAMTHTLDRSSMT